MASTAKATPVTNRRGCRAAATRKRSPATLLGTDSFDRRDPGQGESVGGGFAPSSFHGHHLPLFDFEDGALADCERLLILPLSAIQAGRLRTISNASSGVWTVPRMAVSARSSERAN